MTIYNQNFDEIRKRITERLSSEDGNTFPSTILIDNISYCNLRCAMCPHRDMKRKQGIMEWDLYKKIIDEIAVNKPEARIWITFCGEGLMLKDLHERVRYAKEKGLKDVVLNTNGNLLNKEKAEQLVKAGLDAIYIGIDAFEADTYRKVRIGGEMSRVISGVLEYKSALNNFGSKDQEIFVQIVEMEENSSEVEDFIRFWTEKGINVKVRPKGSWSGKVPASNLKQYNDRLPCYWGMSTLCIADDGKVCLCAVDLDCEVALGDINTKSIKDLWNNEHKSFRQIHLMGEWDKIPHLCKNCLDWQTAYADLIENK